jgi:hypothetical protein
VNKFIRIFGILNAAVWFGAGIFFTFVVAPGFFSNEMLALFGGPQSFYSKAYAGAANIIILKRYYHFQYFCGAVAFLHIVLEWLILGQFFNKFKLWLLVLICSLNIMNGIFMMPAMKQLQIQKYDLKTTNAQRLGAESSFRILHGMSWGVNAIVLVSTGIYLINLISIQNGSAQKLVIRTK